MKKMQKFHKWTLLFLITFLILTIGVFPLIAGEKAVERLVTIGELKDIENPNAEFKIDLWCDRKDANYKPGDEITFFFKTTKDCYLTLIDVTTSGKVKVLFPNKYQKNNLIKAGDTYRVPGEKAKYLYRIAKPYGNEVVKAIGTLKKIALYKPEEVKPSGPFMNFRGPQEKIAKEISIVLKPVDKKDWAEVQKVLKIVENKP